MLYRILESLRFTGSSKRLEAGTIDPLKNVSPKTIATLLAKNRIAEVHPPPLAVIPGFKERAAEYEKQGILDVTDMSGEEPDFEEALRWSNVGFDSPGATPDLMTRDLSEDIVEISEAEDELDNEV